MFDAQQREVLALNTERHARIVGAPGSGKSTMLIEVVRRAVEEHDRTFHDVLVLAPNRAAGARVRNMLESTIRRPIAGTPVRTTTSLAFAILARVRAARGEAHPRLMTGAAQDEVLRRAIALIEPQMYVGAGLSAEFVETDEFRTELRTLWALADDYDLWVRASHRFDARFAAGLQIVTRAREILERESPEEFTANGALRAATKLLLDCERLPSELDLPSFIVCDDAEELTEGALGMLAALAASGSTVWFFGDPDIATGAFHGESTRVLAGVGTAFERKGTGAARPRGDQPSEQVVILQSVHRHGSDIRELVGRITARIGSAGIGVQRRAQSVRKAESQVTYATAQTRSEQLGMIGHRLRSARLGLELSGRDSNHSVDESVKYAVPWSRMAVLCRSQTEAARVATLLAQQQVPVTTSSGGIVARESAVSRDLLRILEHALNLEPLETDELERLLSGPLSDLDAIGVRRLRASLALHERQTARAEEREPRVSKELICHVFFGDGDVPDSAEGRALQRVVRIVQAGVQAHESGGRPREVLWAIWEQTRLAERLQSRALSGTGQRSVEAHRELDSVLAVFFALQRHEEQASAVPIAQLLSELRTSSVPQDTLAVRSDRDAVTVTTPHGVVGAEFDVVCVVGPQEGVWPNVRPRGSLLALPDTERQLRGDSSAVDERLATLHDELRLFAQACSRARNELLTVALHNDETVPSAIATLLEPWRTASLPSTSLTLRGMVAKYRKLLTRDPDDAHAANTLAVLADLGIPGAHPDDWYGVRDPSTTAPLVDLDADEETVVRVSPSHLTTIEECPLNWVISNLGGGSPHVAAQIGTLLHAALENVREPDAEKMMAFIDTHWDRLEFDAEWVEQRSHDMARAMVDGLTGYVKKQTALGHTLLASEASFRVRLGKAEISGTADRIELQRSADGEGRPVIIDLKTSRTAPSGAEVAEHPQLLAYQLGLMEAQFTPAQEGEGSEDACLEFGATGGAGLLYVDPRVQKQGESFRVYFQDPLDADTRRGFEERVDEAATTMAGNMFTARVEHHCMNEHRFGACAIHVVPPVSQA